MVDIIIPVYGRYDLLKECLESIPDSFRSIKLRIYVYDNGTPLPKEEKTKFYSQFPNIKLTLGNKNVGFPIACNTLAQRGNSKYVFLLNSDVVLHPDSGMIMIQFLENNEDVGVLGMKLLFPEVVPQEYRPHPGVRPPGKVQHFGLSFNIKAFPYHIFLGWSADHPKVCRVIEPPAVTGAALMTRRNLWNKIGGLNRAYGMGVVEDVDYCFSVRELGKRILVLPEATGTHFASASTPANERTPFPLEQNLQTFYNRWGNKGVIEWSDGSLL